MSHERKKEVAAFLAVGVVSTLIDYALLNTFRFAFGWPLLLANCLSATVSSFASYKLSKNVVFDGTEHDRKTTLLLYALIIGTGIVVIQNTVLHLLGNGALDGVSGLLKDLGVPLSVMAISINIAKLIASLTAASWNYFMLRRFVFITKKDT